VAKGSEQTQHHLGLNMPLLKVTPSIEVFYDKTDFLDPWVQKPVLILQHGNGRSGEFWYRWLPRLSEHFVVIRPDMRGVGRSIALADETQDISIEHCVSDLVAIIQAESKRPVYYCGESMGGILGIVLAALHPELVEKLILVATPVFISEAMKVRYAMGHGSRLEAMKTMGIRQWVLQTSVLTRFPPDCDPALLNWYVDEFAKGRPEVLVRYSELVNSANASVYLPQITCPTLAIMPTLGQITDADQEELLRTQIKDIQIENIDSKFHMIHLTHHEDCIDRLLDFLGVHPRH
jgi:3-oxoadipate enol-lactonase